ncbi:Protein kinase-like domain [Ceraceosorus bombacis]|uniref:Protein kinase-like domain n=1 Tax=Ceraceosorus bombacis TaxID=401625 RepID=A0A0P1BA03_9BASI|nr:Protein kinase-like domain [Ceraceosorus bombacis]
MADGEVLGLDRLTLDDATGGSRPPTGARNESILFDLSLVEVTRATAGYDAEVCADRLKSNPEAPGIWEWVCRSLGSHAAYNSVDGSDSAASQTGAPSTPRRVARHGRLDQLPTPMRNRPAAYESSQDSSTAVIADQLVRDMQHKHYGKYLKLEELSAPAGVTKLLKNPAFRNALSQLRQSITAATLESQMERPIERFVNCLGYIFAASGSHLQSSAQARRYAVAQSSTSVHLSSEIVVLGDKPENAIRPDITLGDVRPCDLKHSECRSGVTAHPARKQWSEISTVIELKRTATSDGSRDLMAQVLTYAVCHISMLGLSLISDSWPRPFQRMLLCDHPISKAVYIVTWCKDIVRLWCFTANAYTVTRALRIHEEEDLLDFCMVLLFCTKDDQLLQRWRPNHDSRFLRPIQGSRPFQLFSASGNKNNIYDRAMVRPSLVGSRTAVFLHCPTSVDLENAQLTEAEHRALFFEGRLLFVKASWRPPRLIGHELNMLLRIQRGEQLLKSKNHASWQDIEAPTPIALLPMDWVTWPASGSPALKLDILAFAQHQGVAFGYKDAEADLAQIFGQFARQLAAYAELGLHYRDLNPGNLLMTRRQGSQRARLVLADHGNVRVGVAREDPMPTCEEADWLGWAADDTRSANQLFLAHSTSNCGRHAALFLLEEKARHKYTADLKTLESLESSKNSEIVRLRRDIEEASQNMAINRKKAFIKSHRYIDDLESMIYLYLYTISCRGGSQIRIELLRTLSDNRAKSDFWTLRSVWEEITQKLRSECKLPPAWMSAIDDVRRIVAKAQGLLRGSLEQHFDSHHSDFGRVPELPLQDVEDQCFKDVASVFDTYLHEEHEEPLDRLREAQSTL